MQSGTQAPPGLYVGNLLSIYPTCTINDNQDSKFNQRGNLTSTLHGIMRAAIVIPFISNRLQFNSLNVNSGMAFTDMIVSPVSQRCDQLEISAHQLWPTALC